LQRNPAQMTWHNISDFSNNIFDNFNRLFISGCECHGTRIAENSCNA
jgi:hypothetical protein